MGERAGHPIGAGAERVDVAGINALSSRPPGYAVALKCLQVQAEAEAEQGNARSAPARKRLHPDAWPWYQGALGEIEVGRLLSELGPEWFVRHSVPIGADTKDVDHLVIGPGGVFAINTKHHAGASVWVGDHVLRVNHGNTPHLRAAVRDGHDVARRLAAKSGFPVPVSPVIAVLNARSVTDRRDPHRRMPAVIEARILADWLRSRPASLSPTQLELVKLAAEEPSTWHVDPRAADTLRVMQRFERLVGRVGASAGPAPHTPRTAAVGTSHAAAAPPPRARPHTSGRSPLRPSAGRVLPWVQAAIVVAAVLVVRGYADQPCDPATACLLPHLYLAWKPLLILFAVAFVGRAVVASFRKRSRT